MKTGVLLINIGTPKDLSLKSVKTYLREFLSDPLVLIMPSFIRWLLVNIVIVPFRSPKSLEAYAKVWSEKGSPLLVISMAFKDKLQKRLRSLGQDVEVELAMRYQEPSIESALSRFSDNNIDHIIVIPMFPQYSLASTESALREVKKQLQGVNSKVKLSEIKDFFVDTLFIESVVNSIVAQRKDFKPDHILLSYHGLPESHVKATDLTKSHCLQRKDCCAQITEANRFCYRAQCYATSREVATRLSLSENEYSVSFQSRLGRTPWIKPFTDEVFVELRKKGVKRLLVACPSFVADCLETLEEIAIRGKEDWLRAGGEDLHLVPCVNDRDDFVSCVVKIISDQIETK